MKHQERLITEAVKTDVVLTISEYYDRLSKLDWYASFSDSHSVSNAGEKAREDLKLIGEKHPKFKKLFEQYYKHMFSGEAWNTVKIEKPDLPQIEVDIKYKEPIMMDDAYLICSGGEMDSQIWDATTESNGSFLLTEIDGSERRLGVFTCYESVRRAASYSANYFSGGYGDLLIENISIYKSMEDYIA